MKLSEIIGQERVVDALRRSIAAGRVAHAYLFEGVAGCGRRTTALALIQTLFCSAAVHGDACGVCPSCRKMAAGTHPDIQRLEPLPDKRDITIEQVRELQQALALRPFEAGRKACLIEPAERMSQGAANALLKTLEEPPGHAVMILLSTQADLLLPTIRSRCQHLRFSPLDRDALTELLVRDGLERQRALELAALADGSLEQARLLDNDDAGTVRSELLQVLSRVNGSSIATIFDSAEQLAGTRDETLTVYGLLIALLRDMLLIRSNAAGQVANHFLIDALQAEAVRFAPDRLVEALELALATRRAVQGNVNPKLSLERFLLCYGNLRTG